MKSLRAWALYLFMGMLFLATVSARAEGPTTRAEALRDLTHADAQTRGSAAIWLGAQGLPEDIETMVQALRDEDADVRAIAQDAIVQLWTRSGDKQIDELMKAGIKQMADGRLSQAVDTFTRMIELKPEFAEGWNKRATVYYMIGNYDLSLKDCDEVMQRNPSHFGALAGYGLIYSRLGKWEQALEYFERALEVNPNMQNIVDSVDAIRHRLGRQGKQSI